MSRELLAGLLLVDPAQRLGGFVAENNVLRDRENRYQHEVLVNHADPCINRISRGIHHQGLVVDEHLAGRRGVQPGEDVHQRRLAGAVLTEERDSLALRHREVHIIIGEHTRELLGDPTHLELHSGLPQSTLGAS